MADTPIITPEAVVLDLERAGVASRTLGIALDFLALALAWVILALGSVWILSAANIEISRAIMAVLSSLAIYFAWFCGFETLWRGRTPGKAALGLRVVAADGTPVRFQQAFLRATVGVVDFFLVPVGFVAVVSSLVSPRDQRLGDIAAGTLVVRERTARPHVGAAIFPPPPNYERYVDSLDIGALDEDHYELIRSFLLRAHELTPAARVHMAVRIANPVAVAMGHRPPAHTHPHLFLMCVAAAWQRAHGPPTAPWAPPPPSDGGPSPRWAPAGS